MTELRNLFISDPVTGNKANVNSDGQLHVVLEGSILTGNSSNTPLAAAGVFTGVSISTLEYAILIVSVYADQASATDGLEIQFSQDGVNWDFTDCFTISASIGKVFSFQTVAQYLRIVYTNGPVAQTEFRLQVVGKKSYSKPSSHRIADSINDQDDAELVKSVLTGKANGTFVNVKVTPDGYLSISDISNGLSIAKGDVTGESFIHKFGNAPDFDTADGVVSVWDGADDGGIDQMEYQYSTTADIDTISSSNAGDTQDIEIQGLDTNWNVVTQTISLNGQSQVNLTTDLIRVFRMKNVDTTDNAGHIYCYVNGTATAGVPDTPGDVRAIIQPGNNQTLMALYSIPAGYTGYMRDWYASTSGANKTSNYPIEVRARSFGGVFQLKHLSAISDNGSSHVQHDYTEPEVFQEKTDIELRASMTAVGGTAGSVSAGFDLVLIEN